MTDEQLAAAKKVIIGTFQKVRPQLVAAFGQIDHEIKPDSTPVTLLDKQVEEEIRTTLNEFDAGIGFEGEELGKSGNTETFWLVDPIDGTESFIRGLPVCRNVVTLIDRGQPIMTLVYMFITDKLFEAVEGRGATCNGQPIHVSQRTLERSWIEISTPLEKPEVIEKLQVLRPRINGYAIMRDITLVPLGRLDGQIVYKSNGGPWDYAPRALLTKEAGGRVANIGKTTYDYRNIDLIATNPVIFDDVMKIFTEGVENSP